MKTDVGNCSVMKMKAVGNKAVQLTVAPLAIWCKLNFRPHPRRYRLFMTTPFQTTSQTNNSIIALLPDITPAYIQNLCNSFCINCACKYIHRFLGLRTAQILFNRTHNLVQKKRKNN